MTEYVITRRLVGILNEESVTSVDMPRARFIELVEEEINKFAYEEWPEDEVEALRREVMPVAQSMPRFPLQTWMNSTRGCGCVIGEYIVATSELDRSAINCMLGRGTTSIQILLSKNPHADILLSFGYAIDNAVTAEVGKDFMNSEPESVEIID